MGYKILEHTADIRIKVWGRKLEKLFREALGALMALMKSEIRSTKHETIKMNIKIQSSGKTILLVEFLNEVLYQAQTKRAIFDKVKFQKLTKTEVEAELAGFRVEKFAEDIKAVTYHEANIVKNKKGEYETTIIFDI